VKPIVCVRHEESDTMGVAVPLFRKAGAEIRIVDGWTQVEWSDLREAAGIVVFGGDMNADEIDRHPYLAHERGLIAAAVDSRVPVLGVCLGGQLLARALGAEVTLSPVTELGFSTLHPTAAAGEDPLLSAFADGDRVFHWHRDTFAIPDGAVLLATGDAVPNQAFRYGDRAWGIQFHPEVTAPNLDYWIDAVREQLEPEWGTTAESLREQIGRFLPAQQARADAFFTSFAELAVRDSADA
jgi:GMP synthase (glutamine-hydrolysing)